MNNSSRNKDANIFILMDGRNIVFMTQKKPFENPDIAKTGRWGSYPEVHYQALSSDQIEQNKENHSHA